MSLLIKNSFKTSRISYGILKLQCIYRHNSTITSTQLVYQDFGDPVKVVEKCNIEMKKPIGYELLVKMLAAPVNPADINTIQGKYPVKITLPMVAGNEGVGEIIDVGEQVSNFEVGDRIVPLIPNVGTWQTHAIVHSDLVFKVPKNLGIVEAATLTVNPCTAYRMLEDFIHVCPGDTVIQNGGNSAVGQNVIQMCKARNINTMNIVRNRKDIDDLKRFLLDMGATYVLTEEEVRTFKFKDSNLKKPKLGFNCIGGKNALEMLRHIDTDGVMVTYGGMSREPVTVPTSALIFKNTQCNGFWMTKWTRENFHTEARMTMFHDIIEMMLQGKLKGPVHKMVPFNNYKEALQNTVSIQGFAGQKYILDFINYEKI